MSNWTNDYPYENGAQISYDESGTNYDDTRYTYDGKLITIWTNDTKSS